MQNELYENVSSPSTERLFVKTAVSGSISRGICVWRRQGEIEWHTDFHAYHYTRDLKEAREGASKFIKYLGKFNLESKIAEVVFEMGSHFKYSAQLEEAGNDGQ